MLDDGFSCVEVGNILLLDDDTVRTYRNTYLGYGAGSLLSDKKNNKLSNSLTIGRFRKTSNIQRIYRP